MPNLRGVLLDIDGVLYNGEEPIAGAAETVAHLSERAIPHAFVTNTTSRTRAALVEKLKRFGIPAEASQILTPASAAATWLRREQPSAIALFVPPALPTEFAEFSIVADAAEPGDASHVVIGDLGPGWNFETLNRAFLFLHNNPNAKLVALGMTRYWHSPSGIALDAGPFVAALEYATGRQAVVMGKPAKPFFHTAVGSLGLEPREVLMVGDDVQGDVGGAQAAELKGALVRTGKFKPSDLEGNVTPDFVLDSVTDLRDLKFA